MKAIAMKSFKTLAQLSLMLILAIFLSSHLNAQNLDYGNGAGNGGFDNTSLGHYSGDNVTGQQNLFVGGKSGRNTTTGSYNSFLGILSGYSNTTGNRNVITGYGSCMSGNGSYNNISGYYAGRFTTGNYNTMLGAYSGYYTNTGSENVFIGGATGFSNKTGAKNTFVGDGAGYYAVGSSNVFLGASAGYNEKGSNKLYIDNSSTSSPLIYGDFSSDIMVVNGKLGIGTKTVTHELTVKGTISSEEIIVKDVAADYVFQEGFDLRSLKDVEDFINENGHLPDIAPASETSKGVKVGEFNTLLLQKIEELTLYVIKQNKEIESVKAENEELKAMFRKQNK